MRTLRRLRLLVSMCAGTTLAFAATAMTSDPSANASYGTPSPTAKNVAVSIPLQGAESTLGATWATVLMGKNDGQFNQFWELFVLRTPTSKWALVTPPGVADNGGIIDAPSNTGSSVLAGFGASQGLLFSPLAFTSTTGATWSQGGLTEPLVATPSALAIGDSTSAFALVGGSDQQVLRRSGSLTEWSPVVTRKALGATPGGKSCGVASLDAVADVGSSALVGATCTLTDMPGVFVDADSGWHLEDIPVPPALIDDSFSALRLGATSALLLGEHEKTIDLVAAWQATSSRPWVLSAPLQLTPTDHLIASGTGKGTTQFVLVRNASALRAEIISLQRPYWQQIPRPPAETQTIAIGPDGHLDALAVHNATLSVWRLDQPAQWVEIQSTAVPIVYGSSS